MPVEAEESGGEHQAEPLGFEPFGEGFGHCRRNNPVALKGIPYRHMLINRYGGPFREFSRPGGPDPAADPPPGVRGAAQRLRAGLADRGGPIVGLPSPVEAAKPGP